jgi:hypothetical protein
MINAREEIIRLLEKIIERSTIINKNRDQIPQIEIDLVLTDIRDLYEMYSNLNKKTEETEEINNATRRKEYEVVREEKKIDEQNIEPLKVLKTEETNEVIEPQNATEIKSEVNNSTLSFNTNQIIAEKFKDETNSINDRIALNKTEKSVASKINEQQYTDIRKGIGINEKFLFIKELYNGNIEEYDESVNKINMFHSITETTEYLTLQKMKYNWDEKSEAYLAFKKLTERKFV